MEAEITKLKEELSNFKRKTEYNSVQMLNFSEVSVNAIDMDLMAQDDLSNFASTLDDTLINEAVQDIKHKDKTNAVSGSSVEDATQADVYGFDCRECIKYVLKLEPW